MAAIAAVAEIALAQRRLRDGALRHARPARRCRTSTCSRCARSTRAASCCSARWPARQLRAMSAGAARRWSSSTAATLAAAARHVGIDNRAAGAEVARWFDEHGALRDVALSTAACSSSATADRVAGFRDEAAAPGIAAAGRVRRRDGRQRRPSRDRLPRDGPAARPAQAATRAVLHQRPDRLRRPAPSAPRPTSVRRATSSSSASTTARSTPGWRRGSAPCACPMPTTARRSSARSPAPSPISCSATNWCCALRKAATLRPPARADVGSRVFDGARIARPLCSRVAPPRVDR